MLLARFNRGSGRNLARSSRRPRDQQIFPAKRSRANCSARVMFSWICHHFRLRGIPIVWTLTPLQNCFQLHRGQAGYTKCPLRGNSCLYLSSSLRPRMVDQTVLGWSFGRLVSSYLCVCSTYSNQVQSEVLRSIRNNVIASCNRYRYIRIKFWNFIACVYDKSPATCCIKSKLMP